ncbi:unnamed protein product [Effrenium voratum]|nr:unnamed protein product [Effrenium voratum]
MTAHLDTGASRPTTVPELLRRVWPLLLGNVLEWYEFGIYSFLAVYLEQIFFHSSSVSTWAGYAVTFVLRPVGGLLNGWMADKCGRRNAVLLSMVGMLLATVGQGLLPTEDCCGSTWGTVGLVLMLLLRALQGLSAGGELGPIVSYFAESAPPSRIRSSTGFLLSAAGLGFLLANLVVAALDQLLGPEGMMTWGWRLPFLLSLVPGAVSLWGRYRLTESADFAEHVAEVRTEALPCRSLRHHALALFVGFLGVTPTAVNYFSGLWCTSYLKSRGMDHTEALLAGCIFTGTVTICWASLPMLNDLCCRCDPMWVMLAGSLVLAAAGLPVFWAISSSQHLLLMSIVAYGLIFGCAVGLGASHVYIFVADLFPIHVRALGFGVSFNFSMALIGGSAALADAALVDATSWPAPGAYWSLISLVGALAIAAGKRWRSKGHLPSHLLAIKERTALEAADSKSLAAVAAVEGHPVSV